MSAAETLIRNVRCPKCDGVLHGDWRRVQCADCDSTYTTTSLGSDLAADEVLRFSITSALVAMRYDAKGAARERDRHGRRTRRRTTRKAVR